MWALAVTAGATELQVRDELVSAGLAVFCPYTREKVRVKVRAHPRTVFKASWQDVARWPRYVFVRILSLADLAIVLATRAVRYIVRMTEGRPSFITDEVIEKLRTGCDASGRVLRRSELHEFSVGDMLRFVSESSFAGRSGKVLSIEDTGAVRLLVEGGIKATVDYTELSAIG